jgi:tetratricopeptide (TPR) repeat protein
MHVLKLFLAGLVLAAGLGPSFAAGPPDAELFRKGSELIEPYMAVVDRESVDPTTPEAKQRIAEGIRLLTVVTKQDPHNWSAFWFIGKGEQARRNHAAAESAFQRAFELSPGQSAVSRELMIESICAGHSADAVRVAEKSVGLNARDPEMVANLALAYLADGQVAKARKAVNEAIVLDPRDEITHALSQEITAVEDGRKPRNYCPP